VWAAAPSGIRSEEIWFAHWASWESPTRFAQRVTTRRKSASGTRSRPARLAGTRSLGTSGAVLGLVRMLRAMRDDDDRNFSSLVPTASGALDAPVSAMLYRIAEVEQAMLRRDGEVSPRLRRTLPPEGIDPYYSDSYIPVGVEYLSYDGPTPRWQPLA
jgi:hypothetical protein